MESSNGCMKLSELTESSSSDRLKKIRERLQGDKSTVGLNVEEDRGIDRNAHLNDFSSRISGFHVSLAEDVEARRKRDETRIQLIKDALNHLDRVLQVETHRMEDQVYSFRESLISSVDRAASALNERLHTMASDFATQSESLNIGVTTLEKNLIEEGEELEKSKALCESSSKETTEAIRKSLENEKKVREMEFAKSNQIITAELNKCQQALANTSSEREAGVDAFKKFAISMDSTFDVASNEAIEAINKEITDLSEKIKEEESNRLATQDDIVKTLTATVDSIQNNLDMLSQYTN